MSVNRALKAAFDREHGALDREIDRVIDERRRIAGTGRATCAFFRELARLALLSAVVPGTEQMTDTQFHNSPALIVAGLGGRMDTVVGMLNAVNAEARESRATLSGLVDEVGALGEIICPALTEQVKAIRASRMTMVTEMRDLLTVLRDVRAIITSKDHQRDMDHLARFVALAREFQALTNEGVIDKLT